MNPSTPAHPTLETRPQPPRPALRFDRIELAGAFGDLGTLLPIVVGMILINQLSPSTVFLAFGLFYLITGYYYRLPVPVQPLKAVGAIAIAYPAMITEPVIGASGIIFGALLLLFALTGIVDKLAKLFTQPVVRGIQLSLGLVFLKKGIELIVSPQIFLNGMAGRFAFYPQPGLYRVRVEAPGFATQFGPAKEVTVGPYVANIALEGQTAPPKVYLPALRRAN